MLILRQSSSTRDDANTVPEQIKTFYQDRKEFLLALGRITLRLDSQSLRNRSRNRKRERMFVSIITRYGQTHVSPEEDKSLRLDQQRRAESWTMWVIVSSWRLRGYCRRKWPLWNQVALSIPLRSPARLASPLSPSPFPSLSLRQASLPTAPTCSFESVISPRFFPSFSSNPPCFRSLVS